MPTVNTHPVEPGCHIAGHWGQYGPDRLADIAEGFGWTPEKSTDDPRIIREFAETLDDAGYGDKLQGTVWEWHVESADDIERWLNDRTPDEGIYWHWSDGEFYLSAIDENGEPEWD